MNFRIGKIKDDGSIGDLYVGKSAYGSFVQKMIDPKTPYTIQSTRDFSNEILSFQKAFTQKKKATAGLGSAQLNDQSKVVALFATYELNSKLVTNRFSTAMTVQVLPTGTAVRFHVEEGFMIKKVFYKNDLVSIDGEAGMKAAIEAGVQMRKYKGFFAKTIIAQPAVEYTADIAVNTGIGIHARSPDQKFSADLTANSSFQGGSSDYGGMTGASFKEFIKKLRIFPNSTLVKLDLKQKLTPKATATGELEYVGTAIGQDLSTKTGFSYSTNGITVTTFVGYTEKFKGTGKDGMKNNYLVNNPQGLRLGAGVQTKDVSFEIEGKGLTSPGNQTMKMKFQATIPTQKKKKRKTLQVPAAVLPSKN